MRRWRRHIRHSLAAIALSGAAKRSQSASSGIPQRTSSIPPSTTTACGRGEGQAPMLLAFPVSAWSQACEPLALDAPAGWGRSRAPYAPGALTHPEYGTRTPVAKHTSAMLNARVHLAAEFITAERTAPASRRPDLGRGLARWRHSPTPIVTASRLLSLGPSPLRPGQAQFWRAGRQRQGDLQQSAHLWNRKLGYKGYWCPLFCSALRRRAASQVCAIIANVICRCQLCQ